MGIKLCTNQGAGPFWGSEKDYNRGNFGFLKIFLSQTTGLNALIFCMKQPWNKETQVCTNQVS